MKKIIILIVLSLTLWGCQSEKMEDDITEKHFDPTIEGKTFDEGAYLESIEVTLTSVNYEKMEFSSEEDVNQNPLITKPVIENMISLYNTFELNHDSFSVLNFFDYHLLDMELLDREILLYKTIVAIGNNIYDHQGLIDDERFDLLGVEYISRITDIFLETYEITDEILIDYPDMPNYIRDLKKAINGGYQIRKVDNKYYILTDYASALVHYSEYVSDESVKLIDILSIESRSPLFVEGYYQRENETAAYKANEIEMFIKDYPSSVYYDMLRRYYIQYIRGIVSNPRNIEIVGLDQEQYKESVVADFNRIIDRYGNSNLARILSDFLAQLEAESFTYNPEIVEKMFYEIEEIY